MQQIAAARWGMELACKGTHAECVTCLNRVANAMQRQEFTPACCGARCLLLLPYRSQQVLPKAQAARSDGALGFSAVVNIPHSERHGTRPFIRLNTTSAVVSCLVPLRS